MGCGSDKSFVQKLQFEKSVLKDWISITKSQNVCVKISNNIIRVMLEIRSEQRELDNKVLLFGRIFLIVGGSLQDAFKKLNVTNLEATKRNLNASAIDQLHQKYKSVLDPYEQFSKKQKQIEKLMVETESSWNLDQKPDVITLMNMTEKVRKNQVTLWKSRERTAEQGQFDYDELKAEWDALKMDFDRDIIDCLRGIVSLKDDP